MSSADQPNALQHAWDRAGKHLYWARTQGVARLVEEDGLDPRLRMTLAYRRWRWRRGTGAQRGSAVAVFVVGVQRSGTNMLVRGLEQAPEVEVHNENDRRAFTRFRLRDDERIAQLVRDSRQAYVLFKPLCDTHRVGEMLDGLRVPRQPLAVWAYRDVDDRARSALAKFGDANLQALRRIAADDDEHLWQGKGLSDDSRALVASLDPASMSPETAAALFWYLRNEMFFAHCLEARDDVLLSSYDALVAEPEAATRTLCDFLGFPWRPSVAAHVERRAVRDRTPLDIDPRVRRLCNELRDRLDAVSEARTRQCHRPAGGSGVA